MKRPDGCQAKLFGDSMFCARCGLTWDMNDPEPPECSPHHRVIADAAATMKRDVARVVPRPDASLLAHMAFVFLARRTTRGDIEAMREVVEIYEQKRGAA